MERFSERIRSHAPSDIHVYFDKFEEGTAKMQRVAPTFAMAFRPNQATPARLYNHYIDLLLAAYTA